MNKDDKERLAARAFLFLERLDPQTDYPEWEKLRPQDRNLWRTFIEDVAESVRNVYAPPANMMLEFAIATDGHHYSVYGTSAQYVKDDPFVLIAIAEDNLKRETSLGSLKEVNVYKMFQPFYHVKPKNGREEPTQN